MNFSMLLPELTAVAVLVFLLLEEMFKAKRENQSVASWFTAIGGICLTIAAIFPLYGKTASAFSGTLVLDPFALFFKTFFALTMAAVIFISREFFKGRAESGSEFLMVLWSSLIGLFFLVSANDFLLMFVALETFTLSLYIMTSYLKHELASIEAGLKYLIMGSLASAFVIFGIALIFVATGSTSFLALRDALAAVPDNKLILMGLLFILVGLGFKVGAAPFQLWIPDVYEGAPTPVVAYLSVASKSAGFVLLLRILFTAAPAFDISRTILFVILAALTMIYGNLGALLQTNIKRLFGYSSISHAGYLLIGVAVGGELGVSAILYYLAAFGLSNLAAFTVIAVVGKSAGNDKIESYRGLGKRSPFLAGTFFLALLSLAGVPPLAGFFGKFLILMAAVRGNVLWLALLGALLVAVSLYYYLNLVRVMYFDAAENESPIAVPKSCRTLLVILSAGMILFGIFQAPLFAVVQQATKSLF